MENFTQRYLAEREIEISQMPPFQAFETRLRAKEFTAAASLLAQYCTGLTESTITEILTLAYVRGTQLDFSQLTGPLYQRRRKIINGIEGMKKPVPVAMSKETRRRKHTGSHRNY